MIDYSLLEPDKFRCPKCSGEFFGRDPKDGSTWCHDQMQQGCHWSGPARESMRVSSEAKLGLAEEAMLKMKSLLQEAAVDLIEPMGISHLTKDTEWRVAAQKWLDEVIPMVFGQDESVARISKEEKTV